MSVFFTVLLWLSLFLLIWGVIAPADLARYAGKFFTRGRTAIIFGALSFILFVLVGVTAPEQSSPFTFTLKPRPGAVVASAQDTATNKPGPNAKITKKTITETEAIPFSVSAIQDSSLPKGTERVTTTGSVGQRVITYVVTYADGVQIDKQMVSKAISQQPVNQVTLVGAKAPAAPAPKSPAPVCNPNYGGACVPIASDVDCEGHGNGPAYIAGTFQVIGDDIYHLDRDEDGIACNEWE